MSTLPKNYFQYKQNKPIQQTHCLLLLEPVSDVASCHCATAARSIRILPQRLYRRWSHRSVASITTSHLIRRYTVLYIWRERFIQIKWGSLSSTVVLVVELQLMHILRIQKIASAIIALDRFFNSTAIVEMIMF
jgi:hypothetical protein